MRWKNKYFGVNIEDLSIGIIVDIVYIGVSMSLAGRVIPHFYLILLPRKWYGYIYT